MRLHINFLVQQTSFIQTSYHLWKYPSSYIIIFLMMRWPGLITRYYQEKVYISSGCQTLLFHMWPCHKQQNCMSCTKGAHTVLRTAAVGCHTSSFSSYNIFHKQIWNIQCRIHRSQCMMWPHLLLLLILMMVMMVLHHAISSRFHTIRCMTILILIHRALSHTDLRLNTCMKRERWKWVGDQGDASHRYPETHETRETWNSSLRIPEIDAPLVAQTNESAELRHWAWFVEQRAWSRARFWCWCWEKWTLVTFVFHLSGPTFITRICVWCSQLKMISDKL